MRARRLGFLLATLLAASSALAQNPVRRVPLKHAEAPGASREPPKPGKRGACVPVDAIAGAIVTDDRSVELRMTNGARWTMRFAEACPALGYYEGFYYRRARAKFLCAGHDAVLARSGGECPIIDLSLTKAARGE